MFRLRENIFKKKENCQIRVVMLQYLFHTMNLINTSQVIKSLTFTTLAVLTFKNRLSRFIEL